MKRTYLLLMVVVLGATVLMAQESDPLATGLGGVATVVGETQDSETTQESAKADSAAVQVADKPVPVWKQKLYYGYNFDIYYHHDSRADRKENGWSISVEPEIGWKLQERIYLGLRAGGTYQDTYSTYSVEQDDGSTKDVDMRVRQGSWSVTPYVRYRMKTLFNGKVGIWLEAHVHTGMDFPSVVKGDVSGSDFDGLRYKVVYGAQLSPVITYQFNRKRNFQIFFSILSVGYSGTAMFYQDPATGARHNEYTNDVIIFSGKLKNLLANQFTPGLYGLKFGIQKSF